MPPDALDLSDLWLDPALGDGITETCATASGSVSAGFFPNHPDKSFRRPIEIYRHRPEGQIEDEFFALAGNMKGTLEEAAPYSLVTCIYRDGTSRLWPVRMAKDGERDNEAWTSARAAAREGIDKWIKLLWVGMAFTFRIAQHGYAPDLDWSWLPSFEDLLLKAFGSKGIIRDTSHPVYRNLIGDRSGGNDVAGISDLPFSEIWAEDAEFYPERGLGNGGVNVDLVTPLCRVAIELRSGRLFRQWQDESDFSRLS